MKLHYYALAGLFALSLNTLFAQDISLRGQLQDDAGEPVIYANVALYQASDSTIAKVEASDDAGVFRFQGIPAGTYHLKATYVGAAEFWQPNITLAEGDQKDLGVIKFGSTAVELAEATVTAQRAMVEVKPDRTVFNVQGTINSTGSDGLSLLRKAPGVTVDNNDNINVLGRSGVLLYVDGKRMPLTGDDLSNFLQNLPADQIDRIDIITNPGARYEAEGNAGIIDIRLKKDENIGANGSLNGTFSQGRLNRSNINASGNYRNGFMNVFGSLGAAEGEGFNNMTFLSLQNGLRLDEINNHRNNWSNYNFRLGTDFFLSEKHTVGFLVDGRSSTAQNNSLNRIEILNLASSSSQPDSILVARNSAENTRDQQTYNLNYRFDDGKGRSLNVDADYGRFRNESERYQPNLYYDAQEETLLSEVINSFDTPTDIDIYTFKLDYQQPMLGGTLSAGTKLSRVVSDNTFLFFNVFDGSPQRNDDASNIFDYTENVYAGYLSYNRKLSEKISVVAGLRAEQTDATGDLQAFKPELQEPPVELNYLNWFPNAGITYQLGQKHTLSLNYGRRINRPDYNVLNPFNNQISELSYEKGNPFLRPEIVNNLELGYTLAYRYNFKVAYSRTTDQITRLMAPDEQDPRAGFITWDNLASQTVLSMNISAPVQMMEGWNAYFNVSASHIDNQADYGNGAVVDLQAFTYSIFQQHTIDLPFDFKGEVSGYYSGPGVWGGVFEYESNWSLNLGLQRKFLEDKLNVRVSANDLFYETGWDGQSDFAGLISRGSGRWDSRRISVSMNYNFGNQKIKSRKRKTGLEDEAGRLGGDN
jgi:outer membrane receptor protein involved in Fe transport